MKDTEQILKEIEELREQMIHVALRKGFQNNESIAISQKLDQLLNEYEKIRG